MAVVQISAPTVLVNNVHVGIVPNSFKYTEGYGEQKMKVRSGGGGSVETVYANDVETNLSMIQFSVFPTVDGILDILRGWKVLGNLNVIAVSATNFNRDFVFCGLTKNYEVPLSADGVIELEWDAAPAV